MFLQPSAPCSSGAVEERDPQLLKALANEEALAIRQLERSNDELAIALTVTGEDEDFRQALDSNAAVLRRKYARLASLSARLASGAPAYPEHASLTPEARRRAE